MALQKTWRGWERKTEEEGWPIGMSKKERRGREDVHSRGFIPMQNTDGKEKICSRKFPKD